MLRYLIMVLFFCYSLKMDAQSIEMIKFKDLKSRVTLSNDTLYVVNFWATWCKPCIDELPYFEKCNEDFQKYTVKIMLVNLDFNSQVKKNVAPFIKKKKLNAAIFHITDTDANSWINKVDSSWSGAIPATLMYYNGKKKFFKEGSMTEKELVDYIKSYLP